MFNYEFPKWTKKIGTKAFCWFMIVLFVVTTAPLLALSHFNWPSADDMSLALGTHQYFVSTGNIFGTFFYAFKVGLDEYLNWMGYFFSNIMFCYSPHILGEEWHFITGYFMIGILTLGVCYFFNSLFVKALKCDKYLSTAFSLMVLIIIIQSMEKGLTRVEAFYWYSGAINYMFMLGMGLFWIGLVIRSVFDEKKSARIGKLVWACFWGFFLGGANYMTALSIAICSVLVIAIFVLEKAGFISLDEISSEQKKSFKLIWIPALINLIGFMASCLAPGNSTREALVEGVDPVKAVFMALYYTYDFCINDLTRWEVIVCFLLLIPVSFKIAGEVKHRFKHPFIFTFFAYGIVSANMVPPIYALNSLEAGRLRSIVWAQYVVMMALCIFYITAFVRQSLNIREDKEKAFSANQSMLMVSLALFLLFGSALCVHVDPYYYSATSACYDLATGNAKVFLEENKERLAILKDEAVTDPVFEAYSAQPEMLFFCDITKDKSDWVNKAYARYYGKNTVVLK